MGIAGMGLDLTELERIKHLLERNEQRFLKLVLTPAEHRMVPEHFARKVAHVAARFAAKEAAVKALGTGFSGGITPLCIEVDREASGKPLMRLMGAARTRADVLGVCRIHLTLTHSRHDAAAVVILEN